MIKTYDEALKTLNDIRTYLVIGKANDCVQELDKVAKYFINEKHKENPTFSECIKEWETRGWKVTISKREIEIRDTKTLTYISIDKKDKAYWCSAYLPFEEHFLLTKTLKALEVENNAK